MHTLDYGTDSEGRYWQVFHNGDYSGNVVLSVSDPESGDEEEMEVPFSVLKSIVSEWVRSKRVNRLETADDDDVLLGR